MFGGGDALVVGAVTQEQRRLHLLGLAYGWGAAELVRAHLGGDAAAVEGHRRLETPSEAAVAEIGEAPAHAEAHDPKGVAAYGFLACQPVETRGAFLH